MTTRRLATILAADVVGYSRLMGADEEGTLERLKALRRELIDPNIAKYHGRIVKTTGDGLLVEFASVVDAVRCAAEVQRAMPERNAVVPADRHIELRIGINLGDVIADGDDLYGDGVNIAARIEALADAGGVFVSGTVYDQVRDRLPFGFEDRGEQQVKNIARAVHIYRLLFDASAPAVVNEPAPVSERPSIAVLAFTNMSGDPGQEYFSDGIADDIITELSRISSFFVIARNSSFTYKGRSVDVRQVARELGVRYVLEGGVRHGAGLLRISAQLIDAETGKHVWADRFDRPVQDLFALQNEIASTVARAISPAIATAELRRAMRKPPGSLDAWEAYQRGLWHQLTQKLEDIPLAREHFLTALTADPTLSGAYTGLAWLHIMESGAYGLVPFEDASRLAAEQARKAVAADPNDPYAHAMLAFALSNLQNWKGVADHVERALAISPSCAAAYHVRGMNLVFSGHPSEGRSDLFLALQLDPHRLGLPLIQVAISYYMEQNYEKAVEVLNGMVADHPSHPLANMRLAASLGQLGRKEEARRALESAMTLAPESFRRYTEARPPWLRPDDFEKMLDGLRKAGWQG
jgi:adenylate cyclase